jgi:hypothetical protein
MALLYTGHSSIHPVYSHRRFRRDLTHHPLIQAIWDWKGQLFKVRISIQRSTSSAKMPFTPFFFPLRIFFKLPFSRRFISKNIP